MIRYANYLAIAAFALVTLGMSGEAHAGWISVRVDNRNNPTYSNATTDVPLQVCVDYAVAGGPRKNKCAAYQMILNSVGNWDFDINLDDGGTYANVIQIWLTLANTNNLLVVDQVELLNSAGSVVRTWGNDNSTGWCFSSQSSDSSNSHCDGFTLFPLSRVFF
jgi:hypothetical protein